MATEFTLTDGSGTYSWIWENVDLADYDDEDIESLVNQHLENSVDMYKIRVEEQAASKKYPVYGATTADLLEDEEAYIAYVLADLEDEIAAERAAAIEAIQAAKSVTSVKEIEIELPHDMLWQEVDSETVYADATEDKFEMDFKKALFEAGYSARISWGATSGMKVYDVETGQPIEDLSEIRGIMDSIQPEYIEIED